MKSIRDTGKYCPSFSSAILAFSKNYQHLKRTVKIRLAKYTAFTETYIRNKTELCLL